MFKKLLVVTILSVTSSFVYGEGKEVTDSYLLGAWYCVNVHLSASSNGDDDFNYDYDYKVTDDPIIINFLKPEDYDDY